MVCARHFLAFSNIQHSALMPANALLVVCTDIWVAHECFDAWYKLSRTTKCKSISLVFFGKRLFKEPQQTG